MPSVTEKMDISITRLDKALRIVLKGKDTLLYFTIVFFF